MKKILWLACAFFALMGGLPAASGQVKMTRDQMLFYTSGVELSQQP